MSARQFLAACFLAALGGAASVSANAQEAMTPRQQNEAFLKRVVGALPGEKPVNGCFARTYDVAHLAAHPQQKVTQVVLLYHVQEISSDDYVSYQFVAGFRLRNKKEMYIADGSCGHSRAVEEGPITHLNCGVDCDGGGMKIEMVSGDNSLLARITDYVSVQPKSQAYKLDEPPAREGIRAGQDDRVFRLERVAIEQCATLFPAKKAFTEYLEAK